jgi:hypothetical protein
VRQRQRHQLAVLGLAKQAIHTESITDHDSCLIKIHAREDTKLDGRVHVMADAKWLKVKNWEKHQHYKHRSPPWIKVHGALFDDLEFSCLQDASKLSLLCIWVLARQYDGKIPANPEWIRKRAGLDGTVDLKPLLDNGFLIPLADCAQDASNLSHKERRGEESTEESTEERRGPPADESEFSGRVRNQPAACDGGPIAHCEPEVREKASALATRYLERYYGTLANVPASYDRGKLLLEIAATLEDRDDAEALLNGYFDAPKLKRTAPLFKIIISLGLDAEAKPRDSPKFDLDGALDRVFEREAS